MVRPRRLWRHGLRSWRAATKPTKTREPLVAPNPWERLPLVSKTETNCSTTMLVMGRDLGGLSAQEPHFQEPLLEALNYAVARFVAALIKQLLEHAKLYKH